jgi:hypothetical protein
MQKDLKCKLSMGEGILESELEMGKILEMAFANQNSFN